MIRQATPADVGEIAVLWNQMIRDTTATFTTILKTETDLLEMIATRTGRFLVHGDRNVDGFITWGTFRNGPGYAHTAEHSIIVGPRGKGVGRALMTQAMQHAAAQDYHVMVAAISGENAAAVGFHRRMGFVVCGELPQVGCKDGRWLDLILMTKTLNAP